MGFGGFKQSGIGREGGELGLMLFLESKAILLDGPTARYRRRTGLQLYRNNESGSSTYDNGS